MGRATASPGFAVPLTKTKSDRKEHKSTVIETIRQYVDEYKNLFVISFENLRSIKLKELRRAWCDDSR
jgi:mRNA turnover protein 4